MEASHTLGAILAEQVRCAEEMLVALEREHEALLRGGPEVLGDASAAKAALVDTLETLELRRRALATDVAAATAAEWQRLRELVAECKDRNQRNGSLLKARADNVRVALNALRGAQPELYGPRGREPGRSDARPLGTA